LEISEKNIIKSYAADLLANQISYLETQIEGLIYDENIEFLHHTRVMSRRIRNTISVFSAYFGKKNSKKWLSSFKKLTKSLTRVRDLDVQINYLQSELADIKDQKFNPGLQRLLLRKQQKRERNQKIVHSTILQFEKTKTLAEIKLFIEKNPMDTENFSPPETLKQLGRVEIDELTKICFSYVPFITNPEHKESLHNLRIAMKNLRYTIELFLPIYPDLNEIISILKSFQDDLGEIHDCDVWTDDLNLFLDKEKQRITKFYGQSGPFNFIKPGILFLIENLKRRRIIVHEQFITKWNEQFQNQFWGKIQLIFNDNQII
jgi:CHAD domain-containing protein